MSLSDTHGVVCKVHIAVVAWEVSVVGLELPHVRGGLGDRAGVNVQKTMNRS